jgi:hypothetical protein
MPLEAGSMPAFKKKKPPPLPRAADPEDLSLPTGLPYAALRDLEGNPSRERGALCAISPSLRPCTEHALTATPVWKVSPVPS